jgi:hypothetical protein
MINMRLVAPTWIIEPIIQGLIDLTWTMQPIIAVPIVRMRTTEQIIPGPIALTQINARVIRVLIEPRRITALLSARMQTIAPIILRGRGRPLRSTPRRFRRIQPHRRTQPPNMHPRNMRLIRVPARSHLTMSTMRSRRTNNPWGETNLLS